MICRSLYKNELESKWPGNHNNIYWDICMRKDENRKGRECIIPDISRTYHFRANGLNIRKDDQNKYFKSKALNTASFQEFGIEKVMKTTTKKSLKDL